MVQSDSQARGGGGGGGGVRQTTRTPPGSATGPRAPTKEKSKIAISE